MLSICTAFKRKNNRSRIIILITMYRKTYTIYTKYVSEENCIIYELNWVIVLRTEVAYSGLIWLQVASAINELFMGLHNTYMILFFLYRKINGVTSLHDPPMPYSLPI